VATEYETIYSVQISFNGMHDDQIENNLMNVIQAALNKLAVGNTDDLNEHDTIKTMTACDGTIGSYIVKKKDKLSSTTNNNYNKSIKTLTEFCEVHVINSELRVLQGENL